MVNESTSPDEDTVVGTPTLAVRSSNYKSRMFGFFVAPATGAYEFFVESSSAVKVYLSYESNGSDPDSKTLIIDSSATSFRGYFMD